MDGENHSNFKAVKVSSNNTPIKFRCDICGLSDIHKNDFENHLNSRGHKKKIRDKQEEKSEEEKFECDCCNRKFRGAEFYKAHLGSKTHKRNLKKQQLIKGDIQPPPAQKFEVGPGSRKFRRISTAEYAHVRRPDLIRQKYKTRYEKVEDMNYKSYLYSLTAYLTLRLALDQNVEDFKISVNDKEWQVFGDLVINISYKDKQVNYAIQCKKVTQVLRQIDHLHEAKIHLDKQYNYIAQLRASGKDVHDTKFVIFTTYGTSSNFNRSLTLKPTILNNWKTCPEDIKLDGTLKIKSLSKKNDIINITNDPENIYLFVLSEAVDCHLPRLYMYTGQRIYPSMLNQLLKPKFDKYPDISVDYTKYIENWADGRLGGNYKLRKKDVVLKIGEILLSPYVVSPKRVHLKYNTFAVWNQVIGKVDLTIVKNEPFTISKICQPLNMIIEETLSTNIDTITKSLNLNKQTLHSIGEPMKSYFFEVVHDRLFEEIPLPLVYIVFWKAGRIPLLMSSEGQEHVKGFIVDVILFMKQMGVHKKFLIKSSELNVNRFKGSLKIFTCLDDIKDLIDWNEVHIRVSDSLTLPLSVIKSSDPFFFKWVTPNTFFNMSVGKYYLKPSSSPKKIYGDKGMLKIILDGEVKDELEKELYPKEEVSETDCKCYGESRLRGIDPGIL